MNKHKISIVGYGRIGSRHAQIIKSSIDFELVGISETNKITRETAEVEMGNVVFDDTLRMISETKPDTVVICTESGNHYQHVMEIAHLVKTIVVEKPMALKLDHAREMIDACTKHKTNLFVVKQNRYNLPIVKTRELFEKGVFGQITLATVRVRWCRDQNYYGLNDWRGTWKLDGGVLANQASHHLDILQWFLGEIESVFAYSSTVLTKIEAEETMICVLKSKDGVLGIVEATNTARPKNLEGSFSILGENGSIVVGGDAMNKFDSIRFKDNLHQEIASLHENPPDVYGFGHTKFYQELNKFLLGHDSHLVQAEEGFKNVELLDAIYLSCETGQEVKLPLIDYKGKLGS
jgi:UDP-N-acetyl-2-amino-2-deoxyglucuronate dehydrogenase